MKAITLTATGGPDVLRYDDVDRPKPTGRDAVVRVRAAGVCYRDIIDRRGGFPAMMIPITPGHEFAGEVVEVGPDTTRVAPGDRVCNLHRAVCGACSQCRAGRPIHCTGALEMFGHTIPGGYAQYVRAPEGALVKVPDEIDLADAAPLACTAGVALQALRRIDVRPGERVLVTGASGGVGHQAVQLLKNHLGASVVAISSSDEKELALRKLGADEVLVPENIGAFHKELHARFGNEGVDAVLEIVGAITFNASLRSLRAGGRLVVIGNVDGGRVEINPGQLILYGRTVTGSASCTEQDLLEVLDLVKQGKLTPPTSVRLPLADAAKAQGMLERKEVTGRVVLEPPAED